MQSLKKVVNFVWVVGTLLSSWNTPGPTVTKNKFLYTPQLETFEAENLEFTATRLIQNLQHDICIKKSSEIALGIQFTWSWFEWNNSNIREMRWKVLPNNTLRHLRKKLNWMLIDGETQQTLSEAGFTGFLFRWFLSVSDHKTKCTTCQIFNCF